MTVLLPYGEIKGLRNVVERMKSVSDKLRLTAQGSVSRADYASAAAGGAVPVMPGVGQLELVVQKDNQVTIRTTYPKLDLMLTPRPPEDSAQDGDEDLRLEAEVVHFEGAQLVGAGALLQLLLAVVQRLRAVG